ncbi:MAG: hypothetical protein KUG77_14550 [Nannocystaceae bacterium]|nr:hypothetical protein [Nannocystaceae bacterium]
MRITVTPAAARSGFLRVWLRRIPVNSGRVLAHTIGPDGARGGVFAQAEVYGRGPGSAATQRCALLFQPVKGSAVWRVGEVLELSSPDGLTEDLDVVAVE